MIKLSNGKKDLSIFQWKLNPKTGEYEKVPFTKINPDDFWDRWVEYREANTPAEKNIDQPKYYNWYIFDALDNLIDSMQIYPDAETIIKQIKQNIGGDDETGVDKQSD